MNLHELKLLRIQQLKQTVTEEIFKNYYISHSQKETAEFFNISLKDVIILVHEYNFHKPKEAHVAQIKKAKLDKYGDENYNNTEKIKCTNLEKYGYENVFLNDKIKEKAKQTVVARYGVSHAMKNETIAKKAILNHDYNVSILKARETYFLKTGFYNPFENPDIIEKSVKSRVDSGLYINREHTIETCLTKYGVNFPCQTVLAMNAMKSTSSNSKPNLEFELLLLANNINYEREFLLGSYSYDFKVKNILIEINPIATHNATFSPFKSTGIDKFYHLKKSQCAIDNGYRCIHVFDWDDKDKIISLLLPRLTVFARKCSIIEIDKATAKNFIDKHHLQGFSKSNINIGLYFNDTLVAAMTFGKPRYNSNYLYELIRYCSSVNVTGGAARLLNYFIKKYHPKSIISYCDISKFTGDTYIKLGFKQLKTAVLPSLHWYRILDKKHITDNLLRQKGFDKLFGTTFGKGTLNEQLMLDHKFVKVYDSGQVSYVLDCL